MAFPEHVATDRMKIVILISVSLMMSAALCWLMRSRLAAFSKRMIFFAAIAGYSFAVSFITEVVSFTGFWKDYINPYARIAYELGEIAHSGEDDKLIRAVIYFDDKLHENRDSRVALNKLVYDIVNEKYEQLEYNQGDKPAE